MTRVSSASAWFYIWLRLNTSGHNYSDEPTHVLPQREAVRLSELHGDISTPMLMGAPHRHGLGNMWLVLLLGLVNMHLWINASWLRVFSDLQSSCHLTNPYLIYHIVLIKWDKLAMIGSQPRIKIDLSRRAAPFPGRTMQPNPGPVALLPAVGFD